mmetsp:Transcript_26801/g.78659  ORF Transcript_26801/g.78659 Transcript_26801/m.78659 type:complete len:216 (+) Transcript_26801:71-718(+)
MISSHALPPRRPDAEPSARRETRPDRPRFYDAHMAEARAREPRTREYARSPPRPTSGERMHAPAWPKGRREKRVRAAVSLLHLPASIRLAAHRRRQRGTSKEHWQGNKPRARIARGGATAAGLGGVCFHATARGQAGTVGLDGAFHHAAGEGRGGHGGGGDVGRDGDGACGDGGGQSGRGRDGQWRRSCVGRRRLRFGRICRPLRLLFGRRIEAR